MGAKVTATCQGKRAETKRNGTADPICEYKDVLSWEIERLHLLYSRITCLVNSHVTCYDLLSSSTISLFHC